MILKVMTYAESSAIKMFHFEKSSNMQKKKFVKDNEENPDCKCRET